MRILNCCAKTMRVVLFIAISICCSSKVSSQSLHDLQQKLTANSLRIISAYINESDSNHLDVARWHVLREIAPAYYEGTAFFNFYIPPPLRDSLGHNEKTYRLNILSYNDSVFYYQLEEREFQSDSNRRKVVYSPITTFENKSSFLDLNLNFHKIFRTYIDESQLFLDTLVYGNYCGMAATAPKERRMVKSWVRSNNSRALLSWLTSPNTEKQVYAVDGLLQLRKRGYKLDKVTLQIIKYIVGKNGTIRTCDGCIEGAQQITDLIKL